jgi:hypothetical protein
MKYMKLINHIVTLIALIALMCLASGCEDKNEALPATADGLVARAGKYRAQLEFDVPPGTVAYKVFYNSGRVKEAPVLGAAARQSCIIEGLTEEEHILRMVTLNDAGVASTPKGVKVNVYGNEYQRGLAPRALTGVTTAANTLDLTFGPAAAGEAGLWVVYTNTAGIRDSVQVSPAAAAVHLTNINRNAPYYYYSVFRPEPDALDEFKSAPVDAKNEGRYNFFKSSWTIASAGDAAGYPATNAIDGDDATVWRSSGGLPQTITIDMKSEKSLSGFYFLQEQGTDPDLAKGFTVETSSDNETWATQLSAEFTNLRTQQTRSFAAAVTARFFRLTITGSYGASVAQAAEINFFNEKGSSGGGGFIELVNAKKPFQTVDSYVCPWPGGQNRLGQLAGWTHNPATLVSYADTYMAIFTLPDGNIPQVTNGKVYQTVTLSPGRYTLTFLIEGVDGGTGVNAYGVATTANVLPDITDVATAPNVLGQVALQTLPIQSREVSFSLSAQTAVTIGWVYNTFDTDFGWVTMKINGLELYQH